MNNLQNLTPVAAVAYLESNQDELYTFINENPDIEDDYSNYTLQNEDEEEDEYCCNLPEYIENYYWNRFIKFHETYIKM